MSKMCIVGENDSILCFKLAGIDAFLIEEDVENQIKDLAKNYVIVLISENIARHHKNLLEEYSKMPTPALIPLPLDYQNYGLGEFLSKQALIKAIGSAEIILGS